MCFCSKINVTSSKDANKYYKLKATIQEDYCCGSLTGRYAKIEAIEEVSGKKT